VQPLWQWKISITYSECVFVALGAQHAMRMPPTILSSLAFPALKYFSTLSYKWHDFRRKKLLNIKRVLRFSLKLLSKTFLILRYDQNVYWFLCYICQILMNLEFPQQLFEKYPNINSDDNPFSGS
jgi:hypothetical protein